MMKIKNIIRISAVVIVAIAALFVAYELGLFTDNSLKIDKTANVVEEVKKIGEFTSACYYEELVVKQKKRSDFNDSGLGALTKKVTNKDIMDEIVILANGKVRAGFDLTKLKDEDIKVKGDTLTINLPKAEIFDVIINPSGYEIYVEDGDWSHEQVTALETGARQELENNAKAFGLIEKAENIGRNKLKTLFLSLGFKEVRFNSIPENAAVDLQQDTVSTDTVNAGNTQITDTIQNNIVG